MTTTDLPGELSGTHPLRAWLNKLRRAVLARTPQIGPGYRIAETTTGFGLEIIESGGKALGATLHRLKSVQGDYLTCKAWDGTAAGTTASDASPDVYIAKPQKIRDSLTQEILHAVTHFYSYAAHAGGLGTLRTAHTGSAAGPVVETCAVTPEWIVNDDIWAVPASTGVFRTPPATDPVGLLLLHPRFWAVHA